MKMFTKSRLMAVIATSAALSMALAGCSNPTADSSSESDTGAQDYWPTATQKLDGVELTMWVAQNSNKIPVKVVSDFEKATGATVKLETIPGSCMSRMCRLKPRRGILQIWLSGSQHSPCLRAS